MTSVRIEYCVPCGLLDYATETQERVLEEYGQAIDEVTLEPGEGGVFKVFIDGEVVFDKDESETGYDLDAISETVGQHAA